MKPVDVIGLVHGQLRGKAFREDRAQRRATGRL